MKLVCLAEFLVASIVCSTYLVGALVPEKDLLSLPRPDQRCWDIEWASVDDLIESSVCRSGFKDGTNGGTFNSQTLTCHTSFIGEALNYPWSSNDIRLLEKLPGSSRAKAVWIDFTGNIPGNAVNIGKSRDQFNLHLARVNPGPAVRVGRYEDAPQHKKKFWYQDFDGKEKSTDKLQMLTCQE